MEIVTFIVIGLAVVYVVYRLLWPLSIEKQGYEDGFAAAVRGEAKDTHRCSHSSYIDHYYRGYNRGTKHMELYQPQSL